MEIAPDLEAIRQFKEAEQKKKEEAQRIRELMCIWCRKWIIIEENIITNYWQCDACGNIFCYYCAHKKGEFHKKNYVRCRCTNFKDTIWERKTINPEQLLSKDLNNGEHTDRKSVV